MRAISNQTRYTALWTTPWASVSEKRTVRSVANVNPGRMTTARSLHCGDVRRAARRARPRGTTVPRAHGSGRLDGERDPRLPVSRRDLEAVRPVGVRLAGRLPSRPGEGLALLRPSLRDARVSRAEPRPPRTGRARGARLRQRGRDAEHRPLARTCGQPRRRRGPRVDRDVH